MMSRVPDVDESIPLEAMVTAPFEVIADALPVSVPPALIAKLAAVIPWFDTVVERFTVAEFCLPIVIVGGPVRSPPRSKVREYAEPASGFMVIFPVTPIAPPPV